MGTWKNGMVIIAVNIQKLRQKKERKNIREWLRTIGPVP